MSLILLFYKYHFRKYIKFISLKLHFLLKFIEYISLNAMLKSISQY